ncbi:MAG: SoxR reducing system RseC family protein [Gammaproteobacteria bacterium]
MIESENFNKLMYMKSDFQVVKIENNQMFLNVGNKNSCGSCAANKSCGTGVLARYFDHFNTIAYPLRPGVKEGDLISLEISNKTLFLRAFALYIAPLLVVFIALFVMQIFEFIESIQILVSVVFLLATFITLRISTK